MREESNTEQAILQAAMEEFLTKGYAMSKTTEIAKAAGVTHAMFHYYFRTKETLFNKVFQEKVRIMAQAFTSVLDGNYPFLEKIERGVGAHFDLIAENARLPFFVINEIFANEERRETSKAIFMPIIQTELVKLQSAINEEIAKGNIREIKAIDLLMSIVSLNIFAFIASPILEMLTHENKREHQLFLEQRRKENIETILSRLRTK